jgi:FkbM family methyltransferase
VVLDALSLPWDLFTNEHREVPLVVWLPSELDARSQSALLGDPLFRHISPFDHLVHHDVEVQETISRRWGIPASTWLTPGGASRENYEEALRQLSRSRLVVTEGDIGTFRMEPEDLITRHLLEHGAHQRGTLNLALDLLAPGDTVIDAGAHVGTFSVPLARKIQPGGRLVAIEGDPINASLLRENFTLNQVDCASTVVQAVLGKEGEAVVARSESGNTGATRFTAADRHALDAVQATTLDHLVAELDGIDEVALVKLDLEGSELAALVGASRLVARAHPMLICEVSPTLLADRGATTEELGRWLVQADYVLYAISGQRNFHGEGWEVTKLERLEEWQETHFDVLAVPTGSPHVTLLDSRSGGG